MRIGSKTGPTGCPSLRKRPTLDKEVGMLFADSHFISLLLCLLIQGTKVELTRPSAFHRVTTDTTCYCCSHYRHHLVLFMDETHSCAFIITRSASWCPQWRLPKQLHQPYQCRTNSLVGWFRQILGNRHSLLDQPTLTSFVSVCLPTNAIAALSFLLRLPLAPWVCP